MDKKLEELIDLMEACAKNMGDVESTHMNADDLLIQAILLLAEWVDDLALDASGFPTSETEAQGHRLIAAYEQVNKWYA